MIVALANRKLEVTPAQKAYLDELIEQFGEKEFLGLFETDKDGFVTSVTPPTHKPSKMIIIFFFLNLMLNQRLRRLDTVLDKMDRLEELEKRIVKLERLEKILEELDYE